MRWRPEEGPWRLDDDRHAGALQVTAQLARLDVIADLRYRGVEIEADAVDITPCHGTAAATFYRSFLLRPVRWPALQASHHGSLPREWRSEPISIPRSARKGLDDELARFETEFATYAFLQDVERAFDNDAPPKAAFFRSLLDWTKHGLRQRRDGQDDVPVFGVRPPAAGRLAPGDLQACRRRAGGR